MRGDLCYIQSWLAFRVIKVLTLKITHMMAGSLAGLVYLVLLVLTIGGNIMSHRCMNRSCLHHSSYSDGHDGHDKHRLGTASVR